MKFSILAFFFFLAVGFTYSQDEEHMDHEMDHSSVSLNTEFSYLMLEPSQNLRKQEIYLDSKQSGLLRNGTLYFGASIISRIDYQSSNENNKFAYLIRHPTSNNQLGKTVSEAVVHTAQLMVAGSINNCLGLYGELLYDPEQSFGAETITALARNQIQLRKAYVIIGDLNKSPLYLSIGKMDTPFLSD
jgi:hypothetical protein